MNGKSKLLTSWLAAGALTFGALSSFGAPATTPGRQGGPAPRGGGVGAAPADDDEGPKSFRAEDNTARDENFKMEGGRPGGWDDGPGNRGGGGARGVAPQANRVSPEAVVVVPNNPPRGGDFRVRIETNRENYIIGDPVRTRFRVSDNAYVYIFSTDAQGNTRQIFPNYYDQNNRVRSGRWYGLPTQGYSLVAQGPPGRDQLSIVAYREHWRELRVWERFERVDPFPVRRIEPEQMHGNIQREADERYREEARRARGGGVGPRGESLRVVPLPTPRDNTRATDRTTIFIRRPDYRPGYPPQYRDMDNQWRGDNRGSLGSLRVSSNPGGAEIYIDNMFYGRTPLTLELEEGSHDVTIYEPRYGRYSSEVRISRGRTDSISVNLDKR